MQILGVPGPHLQKLCCEPYCFHKAHRYSPASPSWWSKGNWHFLPLLVDTDRNISETGCSKKGMFWLVQLTWPGWLWAHLDAGPHMRSGYGLHFSIRSSAVLLCVGLVPGRPSPHAPPVQANPPLQVTISAGDFSVPARAHYGAPVTWMGLVSQATWIEIEVADITWRRETMLSRDTLDNHHPTLARNTPQHEMPHR